MQLSFLVKTPVLPLFLALCAAPLACGDDKGGDTETSGVATQGTQTQATMASQTMGPTTDDTDAGTATEAGTDTAASDTAATDTAATETTVAPTTTMPPPTTTEDPTGAGSGQFCQEACAGDADCLIGGVDMGYTCQDNRCQNAASKCSADTQCNALFSGWVMDCAAQADCMMGYACVDIGDGVGKCAITPSDFIMCETLTMEEMMLDAIEGGMQITVCGKTGAKCDNEVCIDPCEANTDCPAQGGHPMCNVDTGRCECGSDADCAATGLSQFAVCNNGVCGCGQDSDCAGTMYSDKCFEGSCGCSSVDVCANPNVFDGTMKACEGF
ncbi:hypothetical protein [Nannocystis radixulma]|uniref:Uncharacterized protein n=1 Tax=Nannocystis radixulma TaxID=2995305 RepID=A0ABT5BGI3_9BACT|nr:hypothetical protein [Nannocystis radixulma]MDC0672659.1 hypothetical protein [Nannocystis radixulma]